MSARNRIAALALLLAFTGCAELGQALTDEYPEDGHGLSARQMQAIAETNAQITRANPPRPYEPPKERTLERYHLRDGRALVCDTVRSLVLLSQPDAKERLGELNWLRAADEGRCGEIGNEMELVIWLSGGPSGTPEGRELSWVSQIVGENPGARISKQFFIRTSAMVDKNGSVPPSGIKN